MYKFTRKHAAFGEWTDELPPVMQEVAPNEIPEDEKPSVVEGLTSKISALKYGLFAKLREDGQQPQSLEEWYNLVERPGIPFIEHMKLPLDVRFPNGYYDFWMEDEEFGRERLMGVHPDCLQCVKELPANFGVKDDDVAGLLPPGRTLKDELVAGHLFMMDHDCIAKFAGKYQREGSYARYLAVPYTLLHASPTTPLKPIAIQLEREAGKPVFTPKDSDTDWLAAKTFSSNCDFQVHEFRAHALRTHMVHDPFLVCMHRQLPPNHPVYKLLAPHWSQTAGINNKIPGTLMAAPATEAAVVCPTNPVTQYSDGAYNMVVEMYKSFRFDKIAFRSKLAEYGVMDNPALPSYPYRDDGLLHMAAIEEYVRDVLSIFYMSDADVAADSELQSFAAELVDKKAGDVRGLFGGGKIESLQCLVDIVANIIFNVSVQHTAVNYPQSYYYSLVPAHPCQVRKPPMQAKGTTDDQFIVDMLPDLGDTLQIIALVGILSTPTIDEIGSFEDDVWANASVKKVTEKFQNRLKVIEAEINRRNQNRKAYSYLKPKETANSIQI